MRSNPTVILQVIALSSALLCPWSARCSETRVDSAGGLTTVMTDETDDLDLFLDGNPAGLALLDRRDRFDLTGQWTYSSTQPPGQGSVRQTFSSIPRLSDDGIIRYGGLMAFPGPRWSIQVAGDLLTATGQPAYSLDTSRDLQTRGLVRTAYDAGPFSIGLEFSDTEQDSSYDPGTFNALAGLSSGSSGQNFALVRAGIIATFPENTGKDDPRWQVGALFATQLGSNVTSTNLDLTNSGSTPFNLQRKTGVTGYHYFGPEIHYEVPGHLIIRFSSFITDDYTDFQQTSSLPATGFQDQSTYTSSQYQSMTNVGAFRLTLPWSGAENLKLGGSLTALLTNTDVIGPGGNVNDDQNKQQINGAFGIGLEDPADHVWGLQFMSQNYIHDAQTVSSGSTTATDYDLYQVSLGGEKRLSSRFALRAGVIAQETVYSQSVNQDTLDISLTAGAGIEDKGYKLDAKVLFGQGFDLNDPSNRTFNTGAGITGTIFL